METYFLDGCYLTMGAIHVAIVVVGGSRHRAILGFWFVCPTEATIPLLLPRTDRPNVVVLSFSLSNGAAAGVYAAGTTLSGTAVSAKASKFRLETEDV